MAVKKENEDNKGRWSYVIQQSSIQGLQELAGGASCKIRILWFCILITAVFMLILEVTKITQTYLAEPTLSDISTKAPTRFPDVAFCPYVWIDPARAEYAGMDYDVYRYMKSLNTWAAVIQPDFLDLIYGGMEPQAFLLTQQAEISRLRKKFNLFLARNKISRFTELIDTVAFAPGEVLTILEQSMTQQNVSLQRADDLYRVCYQVNDATEYSGTALTYHVQILYIHDQNKGDMGSAEAVDILNIGNDMGVAPTSGVVITPGVDLLVTLTATEFARVPTKSRPCAWWKLRDMDRCTFTCINEEYCSEVANCTFFLPWDDEISKLCTYYKIQNCFIMAKMNPEKRMKKFGSCFDRCPKPCITWLYQAMLIPTERKGNRTYSIVRIRFGDPSNTLKVQETLRESWYTVLSSIGGTLSLWIGASLLSLIHLLTTTLSVVCKRTNQSTDQKSDAPNEHGAAGGPRPVMVDYME